MAINYNQFNHWSREYLPPGPLESPTQHLANITDNVKFAGGSNQIIIGPRPCRTNDGESQRLGINSKRTKRGSNRTIRVNIEEQSRIYIVLFSDISLDSKSDLTLKAHFWRVCRYCINCVVSLRKLVCLAAHEFQINQKCKGCKFDSLFHFDDC